MNNKKCVSLGPVANIQNKLDNPFEVRILVFVGLRTGILFNQINTTVISYLLSTFKIAFMKNYPATIFLIMVLLCSLALKTK
jgi:hypothetical protein